MTSPIKKIPDDVSLTMSSQKVEYFSRNEIKFDSNPIRISLTVTLVFTWICLGLNNEIIPPCVKGLIENTDSNMERFGFVMSIRGVGYFLGSVLGGMFADLFPNLMILQHSIALGLFAISCFTIPLCHQIDQMSAAFFLAGFAHAMLTSSGNPLISRVWNNRSKGVFNLIHSGYGFGAILTPILIYLMYKSNFLDNDSKTSILNSSIGNTTQTENYVPAFYVVGLYSGIMAIVTFAIFLFLLLSQRRKHFLIFGDTVPEKEVDKSGIRWFIEKTFTRLKAIYTRNRSNKSSKLIIFIVFLVYCNLIGNDKVTNKYLYVYIDSTSNTTTTQGKDSLIVQMSYWIGFSLTRFISFFLLKKIPIFILYQIHLCMALLVTIILNFFNLNRIGVIIIFILFAIIKAPLYPTGMGLLLMNGNISGLIVMVINIGSSIGATLYPYLAGYLIKKYNPNVYTNILFTTAIAIFVFGTLYTQLLRCQINRDKVKKLEIMAELSSVKTES